MAVHPAASGGFAAAAPTYARIRPAYARQVIGAIKERVPAGSVVLDVAAGTGILAGQLRRARLPVLALEPSPQMLAQLVRTLPDVPPVMALAEAVPLADGSVGAVTVGEAFHWFEPRAALSELWRVLHEGGVLAVARNLRDDAVDWVARYDEAVVSELPAGRPYDRSVDLDALVAEVGGFGAGSRLVVPNPRPCGPAQLVERAASTSFVAAATPQERQRVLERVRDLVDTHPDLAGRSSFELPYVSELRMWTAG